MESELHLMLCQEYYCLDHLGTWIRAHDDSDTFPAEVLWGHVDMTASYLPIQTRDHVLTIPVVLIED